MSYTSRKDTEYVVRHKDNMIIGPIHKEEWAEYQAWLAEGNKPLPPEEIIHKEISLEERLYFLGIDINELRKLILEEPKKTRKKT